MLLNTRKVRPATLGEPLYLSPEEIASAARSKLRGGRRHSDITLSVLDLLRRALPPDEFAKLSWPTVRFQQTVADQLLDGPHGWHADFAPKRPHKLYLFVSGEPATQFLLGDAFESPCDPVQQQPQLHAFVEREIAEGRQRVWSAPVGRVFVYDNREVHRSQLAVATGWRYFFRAWTPLY